MIVCMPRGGDVCLDLAISLCNKVECERLVICPRLQRLIAKSSTRVVPPLVYNCVCIARCVVHHTVIVLLAKLIIYVT